MKKVKIIMLSFLIFVLGVSTWFYAYHYRKSTDNLPTLAAIAEMDEAEVNKILMGYRRVQLLEVWSEPDQSSSNEDVWEINDQTSLVVNYNNKDIVVICGIPALTAIDHSQVRELAEEEFAEIFKGHKNVQVNKTSIHARSDDMNHVVIQFEYSSDEGSGVYGFEYRDGEYGSAKLVRHGEDVTRSNLLD